MEVAGPLGTPLGLAQRCLTVSSSVAPFSSGAWALHKYTIPKMTTFINVIIMPPSKQYAVDSSLPGPPLGSLRH